MRHETGKTMWSGVVAAIGLASGVASASAALAAKAGCATCHSPDKKLLGPTYKAIAARYQGDAKAPALLAERVLKGSKDVWGKVPMLPTPAAKLGDADLATVIAWILEQ